MLGAIFGAITLRDVITISSIVGIYEGIQSMKSRSQSQFNDRVVDRTPCTIHEVVVYSAAAAKANPDLYGKRLPNQRF